MKSNQKLGPEDYERIGRSVTKVFMQDYVEFLQSTPRQIWSGLVRGVFFGLGGVIGATLGVALLLWLLQSLGALPEIGEFFKGLAETIRDSR